jgi:hypothetical protein
MFSHSTISELQLWALQETMICIFFFFAFQNFTSSQNFILGLNEQELSANSSIVGSTLSRIKTKTEQLILEINLVTYYNKLNNKPSSTALTSSLRRIYMGKVSSAKTQATLTFVLFLASRTL